LTEQITEKVTCDIAQKMKRDMAKSVDPEEVIDLSMVDDEELENGKNENKNHMTTEIEKQKR